MIPFLAFKAVAPNFQGNDSKIYNANLPKQNFFINKIRQTHTKGENITNELYVYTIIYDVRLNLKYYSINIIYQVRILLLQHFKNLLLIRTLTKQIVYQ